MDGLGAGQKGIRADIAWFRRSLFLASDSGERTHGSQGEQFRKLECWVSALEALQGLRPQAA